MRKPRAPKEPYLRFKKFVKKNPGDGCYEWQGSTSIGGYGHFTLERGKWAFAHRYAYEQVYGPIPLGMFVCHRCDNPRCVRVSHLFLGTPKENTADMYAKGRDPWSKHGLDRRKRNQAIREDAAAGLTRDQLAEKYDLTPQTIYNVLRKAA